MRPRSGDGGSGETGAPGPTLTPQISAPGRPPQARPPCAVEISLAGGAPRRARADEAAV